MAAAVAKPSCKRQAWFCTARLPSDIVIEVDDTSFHLHKFPLMSKSPKLQQLITEKEAKRMLPSATRRQQTQEGQHEIEEVEEEEEADDDRLSQISLLDFPGGTAIFELAAKFCYGVKIKLSSSNVAPLRCAAEYLEMTEEYSENNLISKTEKFLSQFVFKSIKESLKVLKSCDPVFSLAENLGIVQNCIDSIASMASSADLTMFTWPVVDGANELRNEIGRKKSTRETKAESWFEDLARLSPPMFKRLIFAMRMRDLSPEIIESCLVHFAERQIPGISRFSRKPSSAASENEQRELLETVITSLPQEKSARSITSTRFLFGLLRTANILNALESCKSALEKKIGSQLEQATLDDLLIPSYSNLNETLYDVDCVERILSYFLDGLDLEEMNATGIEAEIGDDNDSLRSPALMLIGKLTDDYLSEIASDANLKPEKFCNLALSLPRQARIFDDGLYRAVDVYLEAHPWLPEADREKICEVIDCQKLTLEACTHATQNERLPLRAVVQVLFFEQLQLRHAITATMLAVDTAPVDLGRLSVMRRGDEGKEAEEGISAPRAEKGNERWETAVRENQVLLLDMDSMRTRVHQLERECSTMKKAICTAENGGPRCGWRESFSKRFGCKSNMLGCDSYDLTVKDARRVKNHHQH